MNTEQKAKAYDEAIEKIKGYVTDEYGCTRLKPADIFPELRESEDERIRKKLIDLIYKVYAHTSYITCVEHEDILAWLEKQKSVEVSAEDDKIRARLITAFGNVGKKEWGGLEVKDILAWLEKQSKQEQVDNQTSFPEFTFDDILALQCCMETVKKVQEDKELYDALLALHDKVHDAYHIQKDGEEKQKPIDSLTPQEAMDVAVSKCFDTNTQVEPKFKEGDWVVCKGLRTACIVNIIDDVYEVEFEDGSKGFPHIDYVDRLFHKWTIQDAKDGDVLAAYECYVIFKEIDGLNIRCYCNYHYMDNPSFLVNTLNNKTAFSPATKEQRDELMEAIVEAGYEWDAEKKELKKIRAKFKAGDWIVNKEENEIAQVKEIKKDFYGTERYYIQFLNGVTSDPMPCFVDDKFRLWNIEDAKEGDILTDAYENIALFMEHDGFDWKSYCCLGKNGKFRGFSVSGEIEGVCPATKEQCDQLIKAMAEAGLEWDVEKKMFKAII